MEGILTKYLYYRYLKTCALSKVLKPLKSQQILGLKATRTYEEPIRKQSAPPWITTTLKERIRSAIDFNSFRNGRFFKSVVKDNIRDFKLGDYVTDFVDILIVDKSLEKAIFDVTGEAQPSQSRYVARFERYPLSREETGASKAHTKFYRDVSDYMATEICNFRFVPASLDFAYVIPLQTFKELSHSKKLSKGYKEAIEKWRATMRSVRTSAIRKTTLGLFPRDMQGARQYRYSRKGLDRWVLDKVGDF